ncbi:MAG: class III extradiol ring-cleavage dioxygenase [Deltaproteobacteria bacterium]|nr:class III extradiol ring-cleavage dioxygenase [Deltaproteobacteria bacterium]
MRDPHLIGRRQALRRLGALAAAAALPACQSRVRPREEKPMTTARMPALFLPHGGGPWPFVNDPLGPPGTWDRMAAYLKGLGALPRTPPRAILVISAHWEESVATLQSSPRPPMLYDYFDFPPEAYEVQWPAPGAPEVVTEVSELLAAAGIAAGADPKRGFDHGTYVPLKLAYPGAEVPTLQLSLVRGLDPRQHLALGRALEPLRERGILLVGSGMSYHNLQGLLVALQGGPAPAGPAAAFDDWLEAAVRRDADGRDTALVEWERAPHARHCHPREEHLLPLHVIAGAAGEDAASLPYRDEILGIRLSAVHFG